MKVKRKGISFLIALILVFSAVPMSVSATESSNGLIEIMPFWSNITSITPNLSISSGTATCSATVIANTGTTNISGTFQLQRKNADGTWTTVKTWNSTSTTRTLTWSGTNAVTSGLTYRLRCQVTVVRNGSSETATVYSAERKA